MCTFDWEKYEENVREWAKKQNKADISAIDNAVFFRDGIVNLKNGIHRIIQEGVN